MKCQLKEIFNQCFFLQVIGKGHGRICICDTNNCNVGDIEIITTTTPIVTTTKTNGTTKPTRLKRLSVLSPWACMPRL